MSVANATTDAGSKSLLENEHIKTWDLRLAPGEAPGMHRRQSKCALFVIGDGRPQSVNEDGSTRSATAVVDGTVAYRDLETQYVHDCVKGGDTPWRKIVVQFKEQAGPGLSI